ncbi:MAG: hypothetical protein ACHQ53_09075 [Polyangiales bacterium]
MRSTRALMLSCVCMCVCACGAGAASLPPPKSAEAQPATPPPAPPPPPAPEAAAAPQVSAPEVLPDEVDAGSIGRSALAGVLSGGIGRFLQRMHAEPHLEQGRFVGWRLLSLFEGEPASPAVVLRAGDTVMRVNGQSIERPEQFKNVWDSLSTSSELVLDIDRAGKRSQVRYKIVD